jgi:hypothetical protein
MPTGDDRDTFRALGFVAVRFAWLEDSLVDRLMEAYPLVPTEKQSKFQRRVSGQQFSTNVTCLRSLLVPALRAARHESVKEDRRETRFVLRTCAEIGQRRNDAIHAPIVRDPETGGSIRHHRRRNEYSLVTSTEMYCLADEIDDLERSLYKLKYVIARLCGRDPFSDYQLPSK